MRAIGGFCSVHLNKTSDLCRKPWSVRRFVRARSASLHSKDVSMEDAKALTFRLELYLVRLADINRRWADWLLGSEQAIVKRDGHELQALEAGAQALFGDLKQVLSDRQALLADAERSGLPSPDLQTLAQGLPAWQKSTLRNSMAAARGQLSNLRRLHVATWVLLSHAAQFTNATLQVMMAGTTANHVYLRNERADTGGGQLLDESL